MKKSHNVKRLTREKCCSQALGQSSNNVWFHVHRNVDTQIRIKAQVVEYIWSQTRKEVR